MPIQIDKTTTICVALPGCINAKATVRFGIAELDIVTADHAITGLEVNAEIVVGLRDFLDVVIDTIS